MDRYFEKLPNVYYANTLVKDISRRGTLVENEKRSPYNFYPYDIKHELRSDHIAEYYYGDSRLDWFIYLSNGVIDPYYDWHLNQNQLDSLITEKYGSLESAMKKIIYYQNNWASDTTELEPSYYSDVIPESWRKYYKPNWGNGNRILSYTRKEDDTVTNINRILEFTISSNNTSNTISVGDLVSIKVSGLDEASGNGEVILANSTVLRIQNISGNTTANSTYLRDIVSDTNSANVTVNSVSVLFENFGEDEAVFWSPVTYYDWELERNEARKTIRLVDAGIHQLLVDEFARKMNDGVDLTTNLSDG